METSSEAVEVLVPPQASVLPCPDGGSGEQQEEEEEEQEGPPESQAAAGGHTEFSRQLEEIINTYGPADTQIVDLETYRMEEEPADDIIVTKETDEEACLVLQSLDQLSSPEEKLETLLKKYAELASSRPWGPSSRQQAQQQRLQALQADRLRAGALARRQLEDLCREMHAHNKALEEESMRRSREDEEKRREVSSHFQSTLTDIQAQIQQHSLRNTKLSQENALLADRLEHIMGQYEQREESLEKLGHHRELQQKLSEAKLEQANALLAEAGEKHKREKEYLLREAIDKTKKCYALKEQELALKKKLTLYSQKFDEFQATLSKSNDIYVSFKQEMDKMTKKMKKLEKESDVWKTRFESCNKALADMIEERAEKGKELEMFVLKIQKLEVLCRALQEERKCLYDKIKEVRYASGGPSAQEEAPPALGEALYEDPLTPEDRREIQEADPALTEDMERLRAEQARLQAFASALLAPPSDTDTDEEEDEQEGGEPGLGEGPAFTHSTSQGAGQGALGGPTSPAQPEPNGEAAAPQTALTGPAAEPGGEQEAVKDLVQEDVVQDPDQDPDQDPVQDPVQEPVRTEAMQKPAETGPSATILPAPDATTPDPAPEPEPATPGEVQSPPATLAPPPELLTPLQPAEVQRGDNTPPEDEATPPEDKTTPPDEEAKPPQEAGSSHPQQPISAESSKKQAPKKKKRNCKKAS